jgi:hypothetical protein
MKQNINPRRKFQPTKIFHDVVGVRHQMIMFIVDDQHCGMRDTEIAAIAQKDDAVQCQEVTNYSQRIRFH